MTKVGEIGWTVYYCSAGKEKLNNFSSPSRWLLHFLLFQRQLIIQQQIKRHAEHLRHFVDKRQGGLAFARFKLADPAVVGIAGSANWLMVSPRRWRKVRSFSPKFMVFA